MATQEAKLRRCKSKLQAAIMEFFDRLSVGDEFRGEFLRSFVADRIQGLAPGSSDRVMRAMRKDGLVNYEVVNRANSLYCKKDVIDTKAMLA